MAKNTIRSHKPQDHPNPLLFRTSTACLFDFDQVFQQEKRASAVKNMNNRLPYFGTGEEESFLIEHGDTIPGEIAQMAKKKAPLFGKHNEKIQRQNKPTMFHRAEKTPEKAKEKGENFDKISNTLKDAIAGHKKMKKKVDILKSQQSDKGRLTKSKTHSPQNQQKRFIFSFSNSPLAITLPSPKKSPHSSRYQVSGCMIDRHNKSQAQIAEHRRQMKLSKAEREMEQCTFRPNLVSKLTNSRILAQSKRLRSLVTDQHRAESQIEGHVFIKFHRDQKKQKRPPFQFNKFRQLIKIQLDRVPLDHD